MIVCVLFQMQPHLFKDTLVPSSVACGCCFVLISTDSLSANHAEVANELLLINGKLMSLSQICRLRGNECMASVQDKIAALNIAGKLYSPMNRPLGNVNFMNVQASVF